MPQQKNQEVGLQQQSPQHSGFPFFCLRMSNARKEENIVISKIKSKRTPIPAKMQKDLRAGRREVPLIKNAMQSVTEVIRMETPAIFNVLPILFSTDIFGLT